MSDIDGRVRNLEVEQGIIKTSIHNIEMGIENHRKDMKELFKGQDETRITVVKSINELHKSLPCTKNSTQLEDVKKKINGHDFNSMSDQLKSHETKLSTLGTGQVDGKIYNAGLKGGRKTADYIYKAIMAIGMFILAVLMYKNGG